MIFNIYYYNIIFYVFLINRLNSYNNKNIIISISHEINVIFNNLILIKSLLKKKN